MSEGEGTKEIVEGPDRSEAAEAAAGRKREERKHVTPGMLLEDGNVSAFSDRVAIRPGTRGVWLRGALQ
jgi:hypothetical protein